MPQGRDAVRRRRGERGLPPRNQRGRGFYLSPEEMVDRLDLLVGSLESGNDSDSVINEVMDIVDNLKDLKILTALQHKRFMKKYINI